MCRELTWFYWYNGEPNNGDYTITVGDEDYIVARGSLDWTWLDRKANEHSAEVICEYEINGKSEGQIETYLLLLRSSTVFIIG